MAKLTKENTELILAGPGTGKTTEILNRIEAALLSGMDPLDIAFFSFSTTAVNEGLTRVTKRLKHPKNAFKYFRTLHSMAFLLLGLDRGFVMQGHHINAFAREHNLKITVPDVNTGVLRYRTPDMELLQSIGAARVRGMTIREYFTRYQIDDSSIAKAEELEDKYKKYKLQHSLVDFTDMLVTAVNQKTFDCPRFKYMFIDEAQDLSTLQWKFVERLADFSEQNIIVGDEKQAITDFNGADTDYFLNIDARVSNLELSYRVPRNIYKLAHKVEKHMTKTRCAPWKPRPLEYGEKEPGEVIRVGEFPINDLRFGSWLILVRTNNQVESMREYMLHYCTQVPIVFTVEGAAPIETDIMKAISLFEAHRLAKHDKTRYDLLFPAPDDSADMRANKEDNIKLLKRYISSKDRRSPEIDSVFLHRLTYDNWMMAFDKLSLPEKRYAQMLKPVYAKNTDIFRNARVRLSTIHSAKGMEADNVILYTPLSARIYNEWHKTPEAEDTEAKVLFVGLTRARKKLYLLGNNAAKYSYKEMLE